jgi:hypothetical protein
VDIYNNPLQRNKSSPDFTALIKYDFTSSLRIFFTKLDEEFAICGCPSVGPSGISGSVGMNVWRISSAVSGGYLVDKTRVVDINVKPRTTINFNTQEDYQICFFIGNNICRTIDLKTFKVFETDLDAGGYVLLTPTKIVSIPYSRTGHESIQTFAII